MKKLTIKGKVTLWYTLFIVVLMTAILIFLFISADQVILSKTKTDLQNVVQQAADEIDYEENFLEIDDDFLPYDKGVSVSVLQNGKQIAGQIPNDFPADTPIQLGKLFHISVGNEKWMVFDMTVSANTYIRGVYSLHETTQAMSQIIWIALIAFPFMAILAALGGYLITKKAFAPIKKIYQTADSIGGGADLSKRINLPNTGDEISDLAKIFDSMFDRLESSFQSEKQFTSDVSHELRTPIAVVKSQCEYALLEENTTETVRKSLAEIMTQTNKMARLVSQLLELARTEHQTGLLQFERVDLSELLEIVCEELTELAEKKSITLAIKPGTKIFLDCEQTLLMRLMINLITNAIKYTLPNGHVTIGLVQTQTTIRFTVEDTGIGIAPEHLDKIFRRFYQVNAARTKEDEASFGLGLALCKWIVSEHKGTLAVESQIKKGSKFTATFPILH